MKKQIKQPDSRPHELQSIIDYLVDNGVSEFQVNMLIHINMPILNDINIVWATREDKWNEAWTAAEQYISGEIYN